MRKACVSMLILVTGWVHASALDEWKVKREEAFEFTEKPKVTRDGDRITIAFESKSYCDVTIAVENAKGEIVRHLASGVLGDNPPPPFKKKSLKQSIVWDGKNDLGKYIDDKDGLTIRVSLGLKPRFERSLFWEPRRRLSKGLSSGSVALPTPVLAAAKEGVYVYDGGGTSLDHLKLYDHDGNYVRTIYPFPSDKVKDVKGLTWHTYPQDKLKLPLKRSFLQNTLLTCGTNSPITFNAKTRKFTTTASKAPDHMGMWGHAVQALAVRNGRMALANRKLNRLATDGSSGGMDLEGPDLTFKSRWRGAYASGGGYHAAPRSAALSPDGKWLYLAGYLWDKGFYDGLHGVVRVQMDGNEKPEVFVGGMSPKDRGSKNGQFSLATSVACDAKGRVYVSDYLNDRIQVFDAKGKHLKSIPSPKPAHVDVHQRTGEIYVFSWHITSVLLKKQADSLNKKGKTLRIPAKLNVHGPLEKPDLLKSYTIPFEGYSEAVSTYYAFYHGMHFRVCLDSWATPPTIWIVPGGPGRHGYGGPKSPWSKSALRLLIPKNGKLVVKRDFGKEATQWAPPANGRQRLFVNPKNGKVHVAHGGVKFGRLIQIDPATGKVSTIKLPLAAEDMAFGPDGFAYLKTHTELVRFDAENWRQVPFDYGEERTIVQNYKKIKLTSCIPLPAVDHWYHGGMWVSEKGRVAVGCLYDPETPNKLQAKSVDVEIKAYKPRLYPGRTTAWVYGVVFVHVWDKHGKILYDDAIPGLSGTHGVAIDRDDNVYALMVATRMVGDKPYFNDAACTLMKFKPKKGRIICTHDTKVPLSDDTRPKSKPKLGVVPGPGWVEGEEWLYGGVGWSGKKWEGCCCWNARFSLDYFGRSFAPETDRYRVAVLDTNGNLILRVGRYGNVDDGVPLVSEGGPPKPRKIGGDEVSLMHAPYVATHTDHRLFIADPGNARIVSVTLGYHSEGMVALKDVPDQAEK